MTKTMNDHRRDIHARDLLHALLNSTDADAIYRFRTAMRDLLIDIDSEYDRNPDDLCDPTQIEYELIRSLLTIITRDEYARDFISHLALSESLCPLHLHDYAICFDDELSECAAIRIAFPNHDT